MSVRNKPNYGLYPIDLSVAGFLDLPVFGTRIAMITALLNPTFTSVAGVRIISGGTVAPSCLVNVQIGKALGDPLPFSVNTKINVDDAFEFVRLSWAAQPNTTAFFMIADDRAGAGVFVDAPAAILGGTVSNSPILATTISTAQVSVTNAAGGVALAAFVATRQRATFRNRDNVNSVWIGKSDGSLTNATGYELAPGDPPLTIDDTTAAINAISNVAGGVRVDVILEQ